MKTKSGTEGLTQEQGGALSAARLEVVAGPATGATTEWERGTLTVGSGEHADFRLDDRSISRLHASLELLPGAVRVKDLGSRNGTRYLNARIETAVVPLGGTIALGRSTLRLAPARSTSERDATADPPPELIGVSKAMRRLFADLTKLSKTDAVVSLEGPSGSGKEALARALHVASRPAGPFVVFDCAGVNPNLIESELFGVARGAFTGADRARAGVLEQAHQGTLLFDEPAALPLELQPRLLRVLETREFRRVGENLTRPVTARIMSTSQVALERGVAEGTLRQDLLYRLGSVRLTLPPLAQRREDIPLLAQHFAKQVGAALLPSTLAAMQCHSWPGNVRELKSAVQRALVQGVSDGTATPRPAGAPSFLEAREHLLQDFERTFLTALLQRHDGNVSAAAREAKLARSFLYKLLQKHGLA